MHRRNRHNLRVTHEDVPVLLRRGGASLLLAVDENVPRIVHWGSDLGELTPPERAAIARADDGGIAGSEPDAVRRFTLRATHRDGWAGTPTVEGHADGVGAARVMYDGQPPSWTDAAKSTDELVLPAVVLGRRGLPLPTLAPQQSVLIELVRV